MRALNSVYLIIIPIALFFFLKFKTTGQMKNNVSIKILSIMLLIAPFLQNIYSQWTTQSSGTSQNLVSVKFVNPGTGWAAGETGTILKTTNGGINWVSQTSPVSQALISVSFAGESTGWISGTFGTLIKTTNGGTNWVSQTTGVSGALRVHFVNTNTGWLVGASGTILKSTDGGANWVTQTSGTGNFLLNLQFLDANTGYVCGQNGAMIKTTNGGANWNAQTTGTSQSLYGLNFVNTSTGWTVGANGNIYYTSNGGTSWSAQSASTTDDLNSTYFVNANTGWIAGITGKVYFTQNAGSNWVQQTTSTTEDLNSVFFTGLQSGYLVGTSGKIMNTYSGGVTIPTSPSLSSPANNSSGISLTPTLQWFLVIGAQTYHLVLSTDSLFSTTLINDSTLTATSYTVPGGLLQNDTRYYWRVRAKGSAGNGPYSSRWNFYTGLVGIQQTGSENPGEFKLYNNYPNPFNPVTKIKFSLPERSATKLTVYDINGKELATLVNEYLSSGSYEVNFDAANLSSGTYFYSLVSGDYRDVKRMILVK
jgi:photosystem II stability/assembly factor-like uncharacterized protein